VSLRRRGADQRFTSVSSGLPGIASDPLPPAGPGGAGSGGVAQLGERLLCKQEVIGSIPFTSTNRSGTERLVTSDSSLRSNERERQARSSDRAQTLCVDASRKPGARRSKRSSAFCLSRQSLIFDMVKSVLLRAEAGASGVSARLHAVARFPGACMLLLLIIWV
jgi:hypothetical protein